MTTEEIKLTPEQQTIVDGLIRCQQESKDANGKPKSDDAFGKTIGMSGSKWNMCRHGKYWSKVEDLDALFRGLKTSLNKLKVRNMQYARFGSDPFREFDSAKAIFSSVMECQSKPLSDPIRIVVALGETGFGKSRCCAEISRRFDNVILVNCRDKWRNSGLVALSDICDAANLAPSFQATKMEDALTNLFSGDQYILVVDEGFALGKDILNSFIRWTNLTPLVIVIFAIKEAYLKWNESFKYEARQIRSRTHNAFDNALITTADASAFLDGLELEPGAAGALAKAATQFAGFRLIKRVVSSLDSETRVSAKDMDTAIAATRAAMGEGLS